MSTHYLQQAKVKEASKSKRRMKNHVKVELEEE